MTVSAVPLTEEEQAIRMLERALLGEIKCEVMTDQLRNVAKHRARSVELHLQKRKFANLAEATKTGPVETELANERIKRFAKSIEDAQTAHEKSYKPCSEAFVIVLIKLIFGMVKKKIKVLLRKVVKQYMGLPPWTVYFDTWTGLNHKGFLGVAASA